MFTAKKLQPYLPSCGDLLCTLLCPEARCTLVSGLALKAAGEVEAALFHASPQSIVLASPAAVSLAMRETWLHWRFIPY